ncbi:hypothetical protein [Halobacillus salinus]|uniref:hypothetical protein n=1 Tax=Halobacillus salinus TaxID=192814 RepID=UPI001591B7BC|nr:hypothetical protein [Halobacillus salinus]
MTYLLIIGLLGIILYQDHQKEDLENQLRQTEARILDEFYPSTVLEAFEGVEDKESREHLYFELSNASALIMGVMSANKSIDIEELDWYNTTPMFLLNKEEGGLKELEEAWRKFYAVNENNIGGTGVGDPERLKNSYIELGETVSAIEP